MSTRPAALARYLLTTGAGSQRWTPVLFGYVFATALTQVSGGGARSTLAETAAWFFPVAAWLTVAVVNVEPSGSTAVLEVAVGGPLRLRFSKAALATGLVVLAATVNLLLAAVGNAGTVEPADVAAGAVALVASGVGGVVLGSLCGRPLIGRPGWVLAVVLAVAVVDLVVPWAPPVGASVTGLDAHGGAPRWLVLGLAAAGTAVLAGLAAYTQKRLLDRWA